MPQMAPMNWILLYILFFLMLMFITILNYYMFMYKPKLLMKTNNKMKFNWKW